MDLTLTSARHGKTVFTESNYEMKDNTGKSKGVLKLEKPVEVLFEGVDLSKYKVIPRDSENLLVKSLDSIPENYCFLIVGHWLTGDYGEDRKNLGLTIERFLTSFKSKLKKPALVIKTQAANSSIMDQKVILGKINSLKKAIGGSNFPNIYLIHGELQDEDINHLYNHPKIKTMLSLTKGEGFGRPLLEFSAIGKPIIASGWSGHTDFLRADLNLLVGGKLEPVHKSAVMKDMILEQSKWFNADHQEAAKAYKMVFKNYKLHLKNAKRQAVVTKKYFTLEKMQEQLNVYIDKYVPNFPEELDLVIPGPKTIELPKRPKK
jgi:glycosyltransferase involved in cell wall biosynthesis